MALLKVSPKVSETPGIEIGSVIGGENTIANESKNTKATDVNLAIIIPFRK
jgi:hypothetical protein